VPFGSLKARAVIVILSMLSVTLVGYINDRTGYEISVSVFYLVPVLATAWYAGWWSAVAVSLLSGLVWFWVELHAGQVSSNALVSVWNVIVRALFLVINGYLAAQLRVYLERERRLARQDMLTGLLNGRAFLEEAERFLSLARRKKQTFSLAYIDLDNFKTVNDTLGHHEGNKVLRVVAGTLRRTTRHYDIVARLGGDEFVVMLPQTDGREAEGYVRKICRILEEEAALRQWPVSFSIGAATFQKLPDSMEEALNAADTLMYRVKRAGKRGVLQEIWPFEVDILPVLPAKERLGLVADSKISVNAH
jgi:diguanylate cyclase (GGDEF)-like protein